MLASLTISNIILIEKLSLEFEGGLCALTGETGAGKSILLDSLGLVLGSRADSGLVRQGTDQASVTAVFDLDPAHEVFSFLKEQDLEAQGEIILRRSLSKDGRSKAFINDQPVSVSLLKEIGDRLVEIHGQFDTQNLLNPKTHRLLLDGYTGQPQEFSLLEKLWGDWQDKEKIYARAQEDVKQARENEQFLRSSLEDLDGLDPKDGEEEILTQQRSRLMKREQFLEALNMAAQGLEDGEGALGGVWRALEKLGDEAKDMMSGLDRASAEIQEVLSQINTFQDDLNESDLSLSEIDDRLFALKNQARKHGCSIDELSVKREELARQLDAIDHQDEYLAKAAKEMEAAKSEYQQQAKKISALRQKAAEKLDKLVAGELAPLKLDKAKFVTDVQALSEQDWGRNGMDKVQFLIATNPGSQPGPLNKIASGGELSRFMLALKVVLADVGVASTLIFDEVDSGIGGATAAAVGERLARLAGHKQILVVTHSPQVAALADHHYIVRKESDKTTQTSVAKLDGKPARTEEIARMLSAADVTEEARAAAGKLMQKSAA